MKRTRFILSILTALLFAVGIGSAFGAVAGAGVLAFSAINKGIPAGSLMAGVTPEIWTEYIVGNLFKNNEFLIWNDQGKSF